MTRPRPALRALSGCAIDVVLLLAALAALLGLAPPAHAAPPGASAWAPRDLERDPEADLDDVLPAGAWDDDPDDAADVDRDARDSAAPEHDRDAPAAARRRLAPAPPIGAVLAAAYATAGLERGVERGLARRARLAGLVPWVSVRTGRDTSWRDGDPDVARGTVVDVRATWRLDRLVFEPRELQATALAMARQRERRRLARVVIDAYFRWQRADHAARRRPRSAAAAVAAQAELDALTDGAFSDELARVRRSASGERTSAPRAPGGKS